MYGFILFGGASAWYLLYKYCCKQQDEAEEVEVAEVVEKAEEVEEARERAGGGRCLAKCSSQSLKAEMRELLINFRRDSWVGFVVVGLSGEEVMRAEVT